MSKNSVIIKKAKLLGSFIVILTIAFISFQILDLDIATEMVRFPIVPLLTYLYVLKSKDTKSFFFWFLCFYAIGELLAGIGILYYINESEFIDYLQFYGGNLCFILSYSSLFLEINKNVRLNKIIKRFPIHLIVLIALDVYSVILVSDISLKSGYLSSTLDFVIEIVYNTVIMLLLTMALVNYISRDSKKAMNLLIGSLCIVFSEVIQVAYFYVSERIVLGVVYSVLLVLAFTLFYIQSSMSYMKAKKQEIRRERLENAKL
ncbi:hypothetical protein [Pontimicrobium aquaticum]|uniref:YhhN-like protein n=1 Tax=Pontimicrobium aquaticum TaxID=2565367 RepID=A0A4U0EVV5_9FLAO|nr:hypothetical protein [Pontimicrobium aquaticum]TJY36087.1 hypothetical protein E5167_09520 [Pontimicrobium aquaticum]